MVKIKDGRYGGIWYCRYVYVTDCFYVVVWYGVCFDWVRRVYSEE